MITAYATVQTAVEAMQRGARDYVEKPFTPAQIRQRVERLAARRALEHEVRDLKSQLGEATPEVTFETESPRMHTLHAMLDKAAQHDVPVLIGGENGTGKSALARRLHQKSARAEAPFVVVNCPTLSEDLLASELFGHARGAFTGAVKDQPGRVEAAEGGTLFLDEIGELPPALQSKLLRFLQDKQFERIGENQTRHADVRIVAATNRDLGADVKAGRFREDLLYRLNTLEVTPPLRERLEDVVPLARRFAAFFARSTQRRALELEPSWSGRWSATPGRATSASCATPSSAPPSWRRVSGWTWRSCPSGSSARWPAGHISAATSASTRSSASTWHACSRITRKWKTPRACWASTPRRCGASASARAESAAGAQRRALSSTRSVSRATVRRRCAPGRAAGSTRRWAAHRRRR